MRNGLCRILLALLIAAGVVVIPASSAYACRCVSASPPESLRAADAVFTGRLVDSESLSDGYERVFTIRVGRVFKGTVAPVEEVASQSGEASCGLDLHGDGPFLVFADATGSQPGGPRYFSDSCTGTRRVTERQPVPEGLVPASSTDSLPSPPTASPDAEPTGAMLAASPEVGGASSISPGLMAATLLALAGAVLAVLWRLRRPTGR